MNPTLRLLRIIGSPFVSEQKAGIDKAEALILYNYARKNKIELLYLEALKNGGKLEECQLGGAYEEAVKKHNQQLMTARRVSSVLNSSGISYAIFKSIMPFPATPNDVDMLCFGSKSEYQKAIDIMLRSNYLAVDGKADAQQSMFHDLRDSYHPNPHPADTDVYDVDLYYKASASYLIYLDKLKLAKHVTEVKMSGDSIKTLKPTADLVAIITHSIIPEQLFTLFAYYATLYHLSGISELEITEFLKLSEENHVIIPVRAHCSLMGELHRAAHEIVPDKLQEILNKLGIQLSRLFLGRHRRTSSGKACLSRLSIYLIRSLLDG